MGAQDFRRVEQVFRAVVAAREAGDEPDIATLCGGDAALADDVQSLLRHLDLAGNDADFDDSDDPADPRTSPFLHPSELHPDRHAAVHSMRGAGAMLGEWGASAIGQRVGEFTLIKPIGAGGMGIVFIAEQERPRRTVALKLLRRATTTPEMIHRFEREAHLLGRLNHPGIAQVYAAGVADLAVEQGPSLRVPYIAMELIDGPNVLQHVRSAPAEKRAALALTLVADACDAVQHAHQRAVIHRDLKPANIMVSTVSEGRPQVKVLDFGVARLSSDVQLGDGAADASQFTGHGHLVGTLAYMSPEQVRSGRDVDARSDVYAMGVILFQLLSNALPIDVHDRPLLEAARLITEQEPAALGTIDRGFRGDVETIVSTALQKDVARRYQSPAELARDIRHYLAGEPISARRDSLVYVLTKQAARYRTFAIAAGIMLIVLGAAVIYARVQQKALARQAQIAMAARSDAASAQAASELTAVRLAAELSASRIDQGRLLAAAGDVAGSERLLWDEHLQHPDSSPARWALWQLYARTGCLRTIAAHPSDCRALSLAADGTRFATGGDERFVRIWSIPDGRPVAELDTQLTAIHAVTFSRDGAHVVAGGDGGAAIVDLATAERRPLGPVGVAINAVDYASNGLAVVIGGDDGTVRLLNPENGNVLASIAGDQAKRVPVHGVRFDPTASHLAAAFADGTVRLWNVALSSGKATVTEGPRVAGRPGTTGYGVDFNPDGSLLASGSSDRTLTLWRVSDGAIVSNWPTNNGSARSAAFSADGRWVAVPGFWRTQLLDARTGQPTQPPNLPAIGDGGGFSAGFTSDSRFMIATGPSGTCRIWDLAADPATVLPSTSSPVRDLAVVRVGGECMIASMQSDGELQVRAAFIDHTESDGIARRAAWRSVLHKNVGRGAQTLAAAPDGACVVVGRSDGHLITVRINDGAILQDVAAHQAGVNVVRISADGQTLVSGGSDHVAKLWRRASSGSAWDQGRIIQCGGDVIGAAIRPDGRALATTARPGQLQFWNLPDGKPLSQVSLPSMPWRLTYRPDGKQLAVGSWDRMVQLWDVSDPSAAHRSTVLPGHTQLVLNVAYEPTGGMLASVSNDGSLRVWDLSDLAVRGDRDERRRCLVALDAKAGDSLVAAFLPAEFERGKSVAVGYLDGSVRVWDLNYFDRHIAGQVEFQRKLRSMPTTAPTP